MILDALEFGLALGAFFVTSDPAHVDDFVVRLPLLSKRPMS
jgi:hypothetical protein